ncbi:MAG: DUF1638 domain-containing protein [Candidatus Pacebacteria bacterium]|nr:DUF1638 domain-containing protein [Candidatus Paceibacterota bacterium]
MTIHKLAVVGCGVLEWNVHRVKRHFTNLTLIERFLPAQLHNNPRRLRTLLQETIDQLDNESGLDGICLAFGVCGRGTIGLQSRSVPLIIPRTQDCIGICLGSHARYMEEFQRHPGTKYMTHGWYEKTVAEQPKESHMSSRDKSLYGTSLESLRERYGEDNAEFICTFRESWKRNYRRAAYIHFPGEQPSPPGEQITEGTAQLLDWEHQRLQGDESLLEAMLRGDWADPRLLLVPPHSKTVTAPGAAVIGFSATFDSGVEQLLAKYARQKQVREVQRSGIGLGIDTGGTFTDAVIYDFSTEKILAFTKAPTTHGNLIQGILNALDALPADDLANVKRVGISTTLATNAFIEKKGRPVALLLMSPVDIHLDTLPFRYVRRVRGAMSMEGMETCPVDYTDVKKAATEAQQAGCEAFAISGFGSVINPEHELAVANMAFDCTGLPAVCGHELTSHLNFIERATTAAMNAKLIPLIESLLEAVEDALRQAGLEHAEIMVVKGDGSQMLDRVARHFPVETVLSGPAASVVGAARLFSEDAAVVADMGGTTTDVACLHNGIPTLADSGSRIGDFQTSVRGMAIRTIGLGGDSEIDLSQWPRVRIGPRRVIPICRLSESYPQQISRLDALLQTIIPRESNVLDVVALTGQPEPEHKLLKHLSEGPLFMLELAEAMERPSPAFIPWQDLETEGRIQRYGFTLTDVLHIEERYCDFDRHAALRLLDCWALLLDADPDHIVKAIHREFRRMICDEILAAVLPEDCPWEKEETHNSLRYWLAQHLADTNEHMPPTGVRLTAKLDAPIIPVGAPTPALFPQLEAVLGQSIKTSPYTGVANAFGAIAGDVLLQETARIRVTEDGALLCTWRGENTRAASLQEALEVCEEGLISRIKENAAANRIPYAPPRISAIPHEAETKDGKLFLGVTLTAELRG